MNTAKGKSPLVKPPHSLVHSLMAKHASPVHTHISYLNESGWFAAVLMILLNLGSKYITVHFSESAEVYFKEHIGAPILVFAISWLGSRDIYTAIGITAIFVLLSDFLLNYKSQLCIIPMKYRKPITPKEDQPPTEADVTKARDIIDRFNAATKRLVFADSYPYEMES
jgi:hypothetical protein